LKIVIDSCLFIACLLQKLPSASSKNYQDIPKGTASTTTLVAQLFMQ